MKRKPFFKESRTWWWKGRYIPVRNSWNYHLDNKYLTEKEKELYEKKFGQQIVFDTEFKNWYLSISKNKQKNS
jgi:hypothetical protein